MARKPYKEWSKNELIRELVKLEALWQENARASGDTEPGEVTAGGIVAVGGPYERHTAVIDATKAILMEGIDVALIEPVRIGQDRQPPAIALALEGRINKRQERATVTFLFDADGAAALVSEMVGVMARARGIAPDFTADFQARLDQRLEEMP